MDLREIVETPLGRKEALLRYLLTNQPKPVFGEKSKNTTKKLLTESLGNAPI
jgi:hypothetical protein